MICKFRLLLLPAVSAASSYYFSHQSSHIELSLSVKWKMLKADTLYSLKTFILKLELHFLSIYS